MTSHSSSIYFPLLPSDAVETSRSSMTLFFFFPSCSRCLSLFFFPHWKNTLCWLTEKRSIFQQEFVFLSTDRFNKSRIINIVDFVVLCAISSEPFWSNENFLFLFFFCKSAFWIELLMIFKNASVQYFCIVIKIFDYKDWMQGQDGKLIFYFRSWNMSLYTEIFIWINEMCTSERFYYLCDT